jgi:hypothetical protein
MIGAAAPRLSPSDMRASKNARGCKHDSIPTPPSPCGVRQGVRGMERGKHRARHRCGIAVLSDTSMPFRLSADAPPSVPAVKREGKHVWADNNGAAHAIVGQRQSVDRRQCSSAAVRIHTLGAPGKHAWLMGASCVVGDESVLAAGLVGLGVRPGRAVLDGRPEEREEGGRRHSGSAYYPSSI